MFMATTHHPQNGHSLESVTGLIIAQDGSDYTLLYHIGKVTTSRVVFTPSMWDCVSSNL